jgi:endonuclease IV
MDEETGSVLRYWIVAITILLIFIAFLYALVYHLENPNFYKVCLDGCYHLYDSGYQIREDCINKCNQYVGDALDKIITIFNSTVEKIDWNSK